MDVDTLGNIAFGGLGYASSSITNKPIIGFYDATLKRPYWLYYISPGGGNPTLTNIVATSFRYDNNYIAFVAYNYFGVFLVSASTGAL